MSERRQQGHVWRPITDLSDAERGLRSPELDALVAVWQKQRVELAGSDVLREFQTRMIRSWSIETGILERLYSLSEGVTLTFLQQGFDTALVSHGDTDIAPGKLIAVLRDHQEVAEGLFAFVKDERPLGTSYIKELHQALTRHQPTCEAVDPHGNIVEVPFLRGDWKILPNNPGDAETKEVWHEYCPPEHVAAEMDRLVALHLEHAAVPFTVAAAWLHHRFTQIHPFQDGNGRVARALASLVCIRAGGFPLVVHRLQKKDYIRALEQADQGRLQPLIQLFEAQQRAAFVQAIGLSHQVMEHQLSLDAIVADARKRLEEASAGRVDAVRSLATVLRQMAAERFRLVAKTITESLGPRVDAQTLVSADENAHWFRAQIVATAKDLGYYANLSGPRLWASLRLRHEDVSSLVVSIHHVGRVEDGVMAAIAFLTRMEEARDEGSAMAVAGGFETKTACIEPFTFTARRDANESRLAFGPWLEQSLTIGLDHWRRSL